MVIIYCQIGHIMSPPSTLIKYISEGVCESISRDKIISFTPYFPNLNRLLAVGKLWQVVPHWRKRIAVGMP